MNWLAHTIDATTRSAAPRNPRSNRIDWRAMAACGLMVAALWLVFGRGA